MSIQASKATAFRSMLAVRSARGDLNAATKLVNVAREASALSTSAALYGDEVQAPDADALCEKAWDAHQDLLKLRAERYGKRTTAEMAHRDFERAVDDLCREEESISE